MVNYAIQSYFKKVSAAFYDTCEQIERLEKEKTEKLLKDSCEKKQDSQLVLELIEKNNQPDEQRYFGGKFSKEELKAQKIEPKEIYDEYVFWLNRFKVQASEIREIVKMMTLYKYKFILTTKEEIYALSYYFKKNEVIDIINTEHNVLDSFPKEDAFCRDFLKAYALADEKLMQQVVEKISN